MARSLSLTCRRLQFNKLRFYLYDNIPLEFTGVTRRQTYDQIDGFDSLVRRKKKDSKRRELFAMMRDSHYARDRNNRATATSLSKKKKKGIIIMSETEESQRLLSHAMST